MGNVIVTGGSRGIGLGIVRCLAKTGYCVMALARKESPELRAAIDEAMRDWVADPENSYYLLGSAVGAARWRHF